MPGNKPKMICLTGGGTAGSVSPLLAVFDELKTDSSISFYWIGTHNGPEKMMVEREGIRFSRIYCGKLRRYFSWKNITDIFLLFAGLAQSFFLLIKLRPKLVMSAGGFVSVPVAWSASILRIPVLIHQQDALPGLANRLMSPIAKKISVSFELSTKDYGKKAVWTGNPLRRKFIDSASAQNKEENMDHFSLDKNLPTILIFGGGTGAQALNDLARSIRPILSGKYNIIHLTGQGKMPALEREKYYLQYEFFDVDEMSRAYSAADIVICRCGMGTLTELSYLRKTAILIPIPDSHQEKNAEIFSTLQAAIVLEQGAANPSCLADEIGMVIGDKKRAVQLQERIGNAMKRDANQRLAALVLELVS